MLPEPPGSWELKSPGCCRTMQSPSLPWHHLQLQHSLEYQTPLQRRSQNFLVQPHPLKTPRIHLCTCTSCAFCFEGEKPRDVTVPGCPQINQRHPCGPARHSRCRAIRTGLGELSRPQTADLECPGDISFLLSSCKTDIRSAYVLKSQKCLFTLHCCGDVI